MRLLAAALAFAVGACSVTDASEPTNELAGLWKASRWFGPRARGTLLIERSGESYTADVAGRVVAVHSAGCELAVELPNAEGSLRDTLRPDGAIAGTWFPPRALGMAAEACRWTRSTLRRSTPCCSRGTGSWCWRSTSTVTAETNCMTRAPRRRA